MASAHKSGGVDLDDIFEPYTAGTKPANTGFRNGGVDLKDRYAPLSLGSAAAPVIQRAGGVNLNAIFAAKGTVGSGIVPSPLPGAYNDSALGAGTGLVAGVYFRFNSNGTFRLTKVAYNYDNPLDGSWHVAPSTGVGAGFSVRYSVFESGLGDAPGAVLSISNPAGTYQSLSSDRLLGITINKTFNSPEAQTVQVEVQVDVRNNATMQVETYSVICFISANESV